MGVVVTPGKIRGSNKVYRAPEGMDDCDDLHVIASDGRLMSEWVPSPEERKAIAEGKNVMLSVYGSLHPPVSIEVLDYVLDG